MPLARAARPGPAAWARRPRPQAASMRSAFRYSLVCGRKCGRPDRTRSYARAASRTLRAASNRNPLGRRRAQPEVLPARRARYPSRPESRRRAMRARNRGCFRQGGLACWPWRSLRRAQIGPRLVKQRLYFAAVEPGDVVLIFQQRAERIGHRRWIERDHVQLSERAGPVQCLGDARLLEQILLAQRLHESDYLLGQFLGNARHLRAQNLQLALGIWIANPVIETAPLERVVHFARTI